MQLAVCVLNQQEHGEGGRTPTAEGGAEKKKEQRTNKVLHNDSFILKHQRQCSSSGSSVDAPAISLLKISNSTHMDGHSSEYKNNQDIINISFTPWIPQFDSTCAQIHLCTDIITSVKTQFKTINPTTASQTAVYISGDITITEEHLKATAACYHLSHPRIHWRHGDRIIHLNIWMWIINDVLISEQMTCVKELLKSLVRGSCTFFFSFLLLNWTEHGGQSGVKCPGSYLFFFFFFLTSIRWPINEVPMMQEAATYDEIYV